MKISKLVGLLIGSSILISGFSIHSIALASDIETQDIILTSNGAAGSEVWEYNATQAQGWVQYDIHWQPTGQVKKMYLRCVDNCSSDEKKFQYKGKLVNGKMVLVMRATNKEQGLIRVQVTALVH